jgi:hypothetical protein
LRFETLKGIYVWILGFFSVLAISNLVNATIMWFNLGPTGTFTPYLLGGLTGAIPVYVYLLISVLVTLAFLGATSHQVMSELLITEEVNALNEKANRLESGQQTQQKLLEGVQARVFLVDEGLERTRKEFSKGLSEQGEATRKEFSKGLSEQGEATRQSLESGQQTQQKMLESVQGRVFLLEESLKGVRKGLSEQAEVIKGVNMNLLDKLGPQLAEIENAVAKLEQRGNKTVVAITKQRAEIAEINLKMERLETELAKGKPLLTSQSNVEEVKGIGEAKTAELKEIGITNVGDLIMADPKVVAEKMGSSEKTAEKLQGRAQLSMLPGMKEKALFLLEELDIMDRKSLAEQDPIELSKKINAIFKVHVADGKVSEADKPTIEEIDSWVKFVRS